VISSRTAAKAPVMKAMNLEGEKSVSVNVTWDHKPKQRTPPHCQCAEFLWELVEVAFRSRITLVKPSLEEMGQLIEFSEFPAAIWGILTRPDGGWILVIFLDRIDLRFSFSWSGR
jgi:hypothetical protein